MTPQEKERQRLEDLPNDCLIYLKIVHYSTFKKLFEILSVSCQNVAFVFTKDSMLMNTLNEVQKYIIHLDLNCKDLSYHFNQQTVLYINARDFYNDALRLKDKKSILYLYILKSTPTNFNLTFLSSDGDCSSSFVFRSLEENQVKKYSFPKFQFNIGCTMKSSLFHRLISERKKTDNVELAIQGRTIIFESENKLSCIRKDTLFESERSVLFSKEIEEQENNIFDSDVAFSFGQFSCRKITNFYKITSISENVALRLNYEKPDSPLTCEYNIQGDLGKLFLFFAAEKS